MFENARIDFSRQEISDLQRLVHLLKISADGISGLVPFAINSLTATVLKQASQHRQQCAEMISNHVLADERPPEAKEPKLVFFEHAWQQSQDLASSHRFNESVEAAEICEKLLGEECQQATLNGNSPLSSILRGQAEILAIQWSLIRNLAELQTGRKSVQKSHP